MLCIIMVWPFAAAFAETAQETAGRENEGLCVFLLLEQSAIGYYLKVMSGNVAAQNEKWISANRSSGMISGRKR